MPVTLLLATLAIAAQGDGTAHSRASLVLSVSAVKPGEKFLAALRIQSDPKWHIYWKNPGDSGMPPSIKWDLPKGWTAGPIQWPAPERISEQGIVNFIYEGDTLLPVWITPPKDAKPATLKAKATWLVCTSEQCLPADMDIRTTVGVGKAAKPNATWSPRIQKVSSALPRQFSKVRAVASNGQIRLDIDLPGTPGVVFYPAEAVPIDHMKAEATRTGERLSLSMRITEKSTPLPKRLRGLLVAPPSGVWQGLGNVLAIDVPIENGG